MPVAAAKRHRASRSGWAGLPSHSSTVDPSSSPPARKFHIIQPVVVNQKKRSSAVRSRWSDSALRCSRTMPPWPWTIGLGRPVVPDEYRIHSGWSKATGSAATSPASPASSSCQLSTSSPPAGSPTGEGTSTVARRLGRRPRISASGVAPVVDPAVVAVALDREQHGRFDLLEAVDHAGHPELGSAARPDGAETGGGQERDHRLGHVGQVGDHPVATADPEPAEPGGGRRDLLVQLGVGDRAHGAVLAAEHQRGVLVAAAQRHLGVVELHAREPAGAWHAPLGQCRGGRRSRRHREELPDRPPEPVQVRD